MEIEERAASVISAHHIALQKLAAYLPSALWEETKKEAVQDFPRLYAAVARMIVVLTSFPNRLRSWIAYFLETIRSGIDVLLSRIYQHGGMTTSLAEPDKLVVKSATERDLAANFLMHQKPRAVAGLASRIRTPETRAADREHAVRTLAGMTGRQFHRHEVDHAKAWLNQQGQ
jgi:hypothetical protein